MAPIVDGELKLVWSVDKGTGVVLYAVFLLDEFDQWSCIETFEQGPFDTSLEVAQWAVRALAKRVPPSRC